MLGNIFTGENKKNNSVSQNSENIPTEEKRDKTSSVSAGGIPLEGEEKLDLSGKWMDEDKKRALSLEEMEQDAAEREKRVLSGATMPVDSSTTQPVKLGAISQEDMHDVLARGSILDVPPEITEAPIEEVNSDIDKVVGNIGK